MRPLAEVDHRRDHERSDEDRGDGQHRAGPGRAGDDDEETHAVGDGEGAEVPGGVGGRRLLVAEQGGHGHDDDLHGDDGEEGPHDSSTSRHGRRRRRRGRRAARDRAGAGDASRGVATARCRGGEVPARRAAPEVGVDEPLVDASVLAVGRVPRWRHAIARTS